MKGGAIEVFNSLVSNVPIHLTAYKENKDVARHSCLGIMYV